MLKNFYDKELPHLYLYGGIGGTINRKKLLLSVNVLPIYVPYCVLSVWWLIAANISSFRKYIYKYISLNSLYYDDKKFDESTIHLNAIGTLHVTPILGNRTSSTFTHILSVRIYKSDSHV